MWNLKPLSLSTRGMSVQCFTVNQRHISPKFEAIINENQRYINSKVEVIVSVGRRSINLNIEEAIMGLIVGTELMGTKYLEGYPQCKEML